MISLGMTCESCCILRVTQPPVSVYALFQLEVLFPEQQWQLGETMGVEGEPPTEGEVQEVRAILAKKVEDIQSEELTRRFWPGLLQSQIIWLDSGNMFSPIPDLRKRRLLS